jgi:hypothetical protein
VWPAFFSCLVQLPLLDTVHSGKRRASVRQLVRSLKVGLARGDAGACVLINMLMSHGVDAYHDNPPVAGADPPLHSITNSATQR